MIINNEQLSRLAINFKALTEHPPEKLVLSAKRFLYTRKQRRTEIDPQISALIKNTYNALQVLINMNPEALINSDIDFALYTQLVRDIISWSQTDNPGGYACAEKYNLLTKMQDFSQYQSILDAHEKTRYSNKIEPLTTENLFAFNNPKDKRNILLILTDEQKAPSGYESNDVRTFLENLPGAKALREKGITCKNHHTSANACRPARGVLATSQFHLRTGLDQTDGLAKAANHPDIRPLPPEIPTIGSYFKSAKYETRYIGKQHWSHSDHIHVNDKGALETPPSKKIAQKEPDRHIEAHYKQKNPLGEYGYSGWVGPDPHGSSPHNSAFNRDSDYTRQWEEWITERFAKGVADPFFATISLVNPHDIVYYPFAWAYFIYKFGFPSPGSDINSLKINLPPSMGDKLENKPSIQATYRKEYAKTFSGSLVNGSYDGPGKEINPFNIWYQRFYLYFQKLADTEIQKIYAIVQKYYPDTIVVLTSDHGDMNGAHGLLQKWHSAYREEIEIPLIISHPDLVHKGKEYYGLTSHADLLPTLLKLAGLDQDALLKQLQKTHREAHPPVGKPIGTKKDYSFLDNTFAQSGDTAGIVEAVFFTTTDKPMNDGDPRSVMAQVLNLPAGLTSKINGVHTNTKIESVKATLNINGERGLYVYTTYKPDTPALCNEHLKYEEEFYNCGNDPYQRKNYIMDEELTKKDSLALQQMKKLLAAEIAANLLPPNDPTLHTRAKHKQLIPKQSYSNDLLLFLLAPPALLLLLSSYIVYKNRKRIADAAPVIASALTTWGLYKSMRNNTENKQVIEKLMHSPQQQPPHN